MRSPEAAQGLVPARAGEVMRQAKRPAWRATTPEVQLTVVRLRSRLCATSGLLVRLHRQVPD